MMRSLFLLLPLFLTRAAALVDSSTPGSAGGTDGPTDPPLDSSRPSSSSRRLADQWKVAEDYRSSPSRSAAPTARPSSPHFLHVADTYINDTYQNTISPVQGVTLGGKFCSPSGDCNTSADLPNERSSKHSENVTKRSDSSRVRALSRMRESDVSKSEIVKQESVVRNTMKSSLGSVDVVVPSLAGMGAPPPGGEAGLPGSGGQGRNRTSQLRPGRTDAPMLNYIFDTYSTLNKHSHRNDRFEGPRIESPGGTVSADTEGEAHLDCTVASLQDKLVSWVRRKPEDDSLEILTVGQQTFTADRRIRVEFLPPHTWRLALKDARAGDSGEYECQLSTHPPLISRHQLIVHPPVVELVDAGGAVERDKYYERNSTLVLGCRVRHLPAAAVTWLHQDRVLNDDTQRGGVSVKTEELAGGADSALLVARLAAADAGRYSCSVRGGLQAAVNVHVLNEESLAELHQGSASPAPSQPRPLALLGLAAALCLPLPR